MRRRQGLGEAVCYNQEGGRPHGRRPLVSQSFLHQEQKHERERKTAQILGLGL